MIRSANTNVFLLIFTVGLSCNSFAKAWECTAPLNLQNINVPIELSAVEEDLKLADEILVSVANHTDFEIDAVSETIIRLENYGRNSQLKAETRSSALQMAAGFYGRIADKLRSIKSSACGRNALQLLKRSLEIKPDDHGSIIGYALAIEGICATTAKIPKFIIESSLKIKLIPESKSALSFIETLPDSVKVESSLSKRPVQSNLEKCASGEAVQN